MAMSNTKEKTVLHYLLLKPIINCKPSALAKISKIRKELFAVTQLLSFKQAAAAEVYFITLL
jgi:hypothetical protein